MKRRFLHTRSFRRMHFSGFRFRWTKNGKVSEKFPGLSRNGPQERRAIADTVR